VYSAGTLLFSTVILGSIYSNDVVVYGDKRLFYDLLSHSYLYHCVWTLEWNNGSYFTADNIRPTTLSQTRLHGMAEIAGVDMQCPPMILSSSLNVHFRYSSPPVCIYVFAHLFLVMFNDNSRSPLSVICI